MSQPTWSGYGAGAPPGARAGPPTTPMPGIPAPGNLAPQRPEPGAATPATLIGRSDERRGVRRAVGIALAVIVAGVVGVLGFMVLRQHTLVGNLRDELAAATSQAEQARREAAELQQQLDEATVDKRRPSDPARGGGGVQSQTVPPPVATEPPPAAPPPNQDPTQTAIASVVRVRTDKFEGSGFVLEGLPLPAGMASAIITNQHVVKGAKRVTVRQGDASYNGTVGATDGGNDLAIVYIKEALPAMKWGVRSGHPPKVGDPVTAIGSPYGKENTVTTGNLKSVEPDLLLSTAVLKPGNSGGPLVNAFGEVIGVNTSKLDGGEGSYMSVPVELLCDDLVKC